MASIVEIQSATTSVKCDDRGAARHLINVHNTSGRKLRIGARAHLDPPAATDWIGDIFLPANVQQREWELDVDKTIQLTVPIQASEAAPGSYTFRVEVYSSDAPSEDYTTGDGIAFTVMEKQADPEPPSKRFPWWIAVAVLAVVIGGGLGWWAFAHFSKLRVPDLEGLPRDAAVAAIDAAGLVVGDIAAETSADAPQDTVLRQKPDAGKRVARSSAVHLVVAEAAAPPPPAAPGIHKQGTFTVRQTWSGDLDTGTETSQGADFWFRAETADRRYLEPKNGAAFRLVGGSGRDYAACRDAAADSARIPVGLLASGVWVCGRTSEGRVTAFALTEAVGASPGVMRISFITWRKPRIVRPLDTIRNPTVIGRPQ